MSFAQFWAEDGKSMAAFVSGFASAAKAVQEDPRKVWEGSKGVGQSYACMRDQSQYLASFQFIF